VVVFDLIINNADRKGGHILRDEHDHLWLIDHGLCFHAEEKLRTVVWDFSGEEIPDDMMAAVSQLTDQFKRRPASCTALLQSTCARLRSQPCKPARAACARWDASPRRLRPAARIPGRRSKPAARIPACRKRCGLFIRKQQCNFHWLLSVLVT
jgi:hypothetical protein